ncbi:hypothetical protein ABIB14_003190 [Arthrobacter sp. UYEF3]
MLSLARRRLNVLWAMLRDGTTYTLARTRTLPAIFGCITRLNRGRGVCRGPAVVRQPGQVVGRS